MKSLLNKVPLDNNYAKDKILLMLDDISLQLKRTWNKETIKWIYVNL